MHLMGCRCSRSTLSRVYQNTPFLTVYEAHQKGLQGWVWANSTNGYINDFDVYTGKGESVTANLGAKVVERLSRALVGGHYCLYFDNFFSSLSLFDTLLADGLYACGTFRKHRRGIPEEIKTVKPGKTNIPPTSVMIYKIECARMIRKLYVHVILHMMYNIIYNMIYKQILIYKVTNKHQVRKASLPASISKLLVHVSLHVICQTHVHAMTTHVHAIIHNNAEIV